MGVAVRLMVFMIECVVVVVMVDNGWEMVENMVDVMVFGECWCLVWWVGGPSISSFIMEYFLVVLKSFSSSTSRSVPRRFMSHSPALNEIMSFSKIWFSSLLFIWLSITCEGIMVDNQVSSLHMVNGVYVCV